jgi:hypothetical protein
MQTEISYGIDHPVHLFCNGVPISNELVPFGLLRRLKEPALSFRIRAFRMSRTELLIVCSSRWT